MDNVKLKMDDKGHGSFVIEEGSVQLAEMVVAQKDGELIVYHTEVDPEAEGKGLAKELLAAMTEYAHSNHLKVIPLCSYVLLQFRRHPKEYEDIWKKSKDD